MDTQSVGGEDMAARRRYQFTKKKHSRKGILAFVGSVLLFLFFWFMIIQAFRHAGQLSMYYGSAGLCALFLTLANLIFAVHSMGEEDVFQLYPRLAAAVSALTLICWLGLYAIGFMGL